MNACFMKRILGFLLVLVAALGCGCSGINASKSISPLDFILPGLMQNVPPAPVMPNATTALPELAQASHDSPPMQTQPSSSL